MRRIGFTLMVVLMVGAGVAAASALVTQDSNAGDGGSERLEPDGRPATVRVIAEDPVGGPPWGVRVYRSRHGLTCPNAGRVAGDRFGRVGSRGEHIPLPLAADGACADLSTAPLALAVQRHPPRPGQGERGVAFGVASGRVRDIAYRTPAGEQRLETTPEGAFLAVEADARMTGAVLVVTMSDGERRTYRLDE